MREPSEARRSYKPADERRRMLLEHALELFSAHPYAEVSIDHIASQAGTSKGLMYHYFKGKRELYLEVIRAACGELEATLVIDPKVTREENMRVGLLALLAFARRRQKAYAAFLSGSNDPEVAAILAGTRQVLADRILLGLGYEAAPPCYRLAIRTFIGAVDGAITDWLAHDDLPAEGVVNLLMAGLFASLLVARQHAPPDAAPLDLSPGAAHFGLLLGTAGR